MLWNRISAPADQLVNRNEQKTLELNINTGNQQDINSVMESDMSAEVYPIEDGNDFSSNLIEYIRTFTEY